RTWNDGHMRIAIVGAGIGGLSAAAGLQRAGAEVTVIERASELRAGGSGLSLFANGLAALQSLGLLDDFEAVTDRGVKVFGSGGRRADGRWSARAPEAAVASLRIVDRAGLHRILLDALRPDTVRTGAEVASAPVRTVSGRSASSRMRCRSARSTMRREPTASSGTCAIQRPSARR